MKKIAAILLAIGLTLVVSSGVFAEVSIKAGFQPSGTVESVYSTTGGFSFSIRDSRTVGNSFYVGGEISRQTVEGLIYGAGAEYQLYREAEGGSSSFSFLPVYGMVRADFPITKKTRSFVFGRMGYNFYQEANPIDGFSLNGGLYYAAGVGLILSKAIEMQIMYSCNNGEAKSSYLNVQHAYTNVSLGMGIRI